MATIDLYPSTAVWAEAFTLAALANVLGNTTAYATHSGAVGLYNALSGRFYFPMTDIPEGAIINSITANVIAKASATGRRSMYSVDAYGAGTILRTPDIAMGTTDATYSVTMTGAEFLSAGWTSAALRNNSIEWTVSLLSKSAVSTITSWQKFWLTVDYTLAAAGGPNALFLGENF